MDSRLINKTSAINSFISQKEKLAGGLLPLLTDAAVEERSGRTEERATELNSLSVKICDSMKNWENLQESPNPIVTRCI